MLRTLLVLTLVTAFLGAGVVSPVGALAGYVWFALFRPQEWAWMSVAFLRLSLVMAVALWGRAILGGYLPNITHSVSVGIMSMLAVSIVAHQFAPNSDISWRWLEFFIKLSTTTLLLISLLDTPRRLFLILAVMSLSFGFHSTKAGLASLLGGGLRFTAGMAGAFLDNNGYAIGAAMVVPLLWVTASNVRHFWPVCPRLAVWGLYLSIPLSAFAVISTFSRSGFLALVVSLVGISWHASANIGRFVGWLVLIAVLGALAPIRDSYVDRLETIATYEDVGDRSAISRLHFWRVATNMVQDHPFGVGWFNYEQMYDEYDETRGRFGFKRSVHSSHLQVLSEAGFAGALTWGLLFMRSFWLCRSIRRDRRLEILEPGERKFFQSTASALMISMSAFIVGGMFIAMALNDLTWFTFGLVAALDILRHKAVQPMQRAPVWQQERVAS